MNDLVTEMNTGEREEGETLEAIEERLEEEGADSDIFNMMGITEKKNEMKELLDNLHTPIWNDHSGRTQ